MMLKSLQNYWLYNLTSILHNSMPIVVESVSLEKFLSWLQEQ